MDVVSLIGPDRDGASRWHRRVLSVIQISHLLLFVIRLDKW